MRSSEKHSFSASTFHDQFGISFIDRTMQDILIEVSFEHGLNQEEAKKLRDRLSRS
ncbi:hypothetical protein Q4O60_04950 [Aeribacillus pallidus]|nr:hypothetical protein [Aeribacillus pallidus]